MSGSQPAARPLRVAILVLSDKGVRGEREDLSGPALQTWVTAQGCEVPVLDLLPDERPIIAERLVQYCDQQVADVVLTCGGTGVSPRDVTPEATGDVIERLIPGFGEAMRAASLAKSPHALVSRAMAGTRAETLIINLPGSPRAAVENLAAVWSAVPHLVAKLQGDPSDCAAPGQL